jgi:hypothetical protein
LLEIAAGVRHLWEEGTAPILGLSSAGPAFYAITEHTAPCIHAFERQGLETFTVPLFNGTYRVRSRTGARPMSWVEDTCQLHATEGMGQRPGEIIA